MNKKVTHILSLTIFLLAAIGFSIYNTQFSTVEQEENNETRVNSRELASLAVNDTSDVLLESTSEITDIMLINSELLSLENEVEVINESAKTSYYHDKFNGKKTASGQVFNNGKYTAAHKTLPFGSKLRVTNNENDESVIVTVNDRGPFTKGRHLDLSKQAFLDITHNKGAGVLNVKIEVLPEDYEDSKLDLQESLDEFML
nr:septal ring lytic transglycosylase RlpA family protein [Paenimyroides tangerinum]